MWFKKIMWGALMVGKRGVERGVGVGYGGGVCRWAKGGMEMDDGKGGGGYGE